MDPAGYLTGASANNLSAQQAQTWLLWQKVAGKEKQALLSHRMKEYFGFHVAERGAST